MVRLSGRIDVDSSPDLRDRLRTLLSEEALPQTIIVDLAGVPYIETSGVATLIEALRIARHHQIKFRLQGLSGAVLRLFQVTGVLALFDASIRGKAIGTKGVLMANVLESVGERTIEHLDYVGSLNIQWWATLRAMGRALPFVGNRYRWQATREANAGNRRRRDAHGVVDGDLLGIHSGHAGGLGVAPFWSSALCH